MEREIGLLEKQKKQLIEKMNAGSASHQELAQWASQIEQTDRDLAAKSDRWLELAELL